MTEPNTTEEAIAAMSARPLGDVKILMVEDDTAFSELVLMKLSEAGCIPYSCTTGEEAIGLAEQYEPDLIILDLMLPGIQGEEILKQLKDHDTLSEIPVIVASNKSDVKDVDRNLEAGAAEYLVKSSIDLSHIVETVKTVLARV